MITYQDYKKDLYEDKKDQDKQKIIDPKNEDYKLGFELAKKSLERYKHLLKKS